MLDEMREMRDEFVNTYTVLQSRLEQIEMTASMLCENVEVSRGRSVRFRRYSIK